MRCLLAIFRGQGQGFENLNGALITLVPKKDGAVDMREFRAISLVHSFFKLLAKILALRLALRLAELVDSNQNTFVRGSRIHDNFVLVQQSAHQLHRAQCAGNASQDGCGARIQQCRLVVPRQCPLSTWLRP
jgi:hypothetical protein